MHDLERDLARWMGRAQQGDELAYADLLRETSVLLRRHLKRHLPQDQVEDVVQETLIAIHQYRHTFDPTRPFEPWMYAIARHRMLDSIAARRRRREVALVQDERQTEGHDATAARATVRNALTMLSVPQRDVIERMKLEGASVSEVATALQVSESWVKINAHRGYKALRRILEKALA